MAKRNDPGRGHAVLSRPRLLFYIQHLLGIGHLVRGARVARAAAAGGFDVTVVVGGILPDGLDFGTSTVRTLPPVKAGPAGFSDLVTPDGQPFDAPRRDARRDRLLGLFDEARPDILLLEAFPFGRRAMRFELLPLLEAARARADPPLVISSVRDILQRSSKVGRDAEAVDLVRRWFDQVIVHGDPGFCPLERSFQLATAIGDRIAYSGLVGPPAPAADEGAAEVFEVIVSVGGGAVGARLIETALAARPLSRLAGASWLVLTGPNLTRAEDRPPPGVTLRAFAPDLPARLRRAKLSISQAGYNTVADLLGAPACRAVLVPYGEGGETEQRQRAAILDALGWAVALEDSGLTPEDLARGLDRALALPERAAPIALDGAGRTCALLHQALEEKLRLPITR